MRAHSQQCRTGDAGTLTISDALGENCKQQAPLSEEQEKRQEAEAERCFVHAFFFFRARIKSDFRRAHAQNYQTKVGR